MKATLLYLHLAFEKFEVLANVLIDHLFQYAKQLFVDYFRTALLLPLAYLYMGLLAFFLEVLFHRHISL